MRIRKFNIAIFSILTLSLSTLQGCSKDDDGGNSGVQAGCSIDGTIDESLVGNWTGKVNFTSDNSSYSIQTKLLSDGKYENTGTSLEDVYGCWRVVNGRLRIEGYYQSNSGRVELSQQATIHNADSISGSHTATNGESGTFWLTR